MPYPKRVWQAQPSRNACRLPEEDRAGVAAVMRVRVHPRHDTPAGAHGREIDVELSKHALREICKIAQQVGAIGSFQEKEIG